MTLPVAERIVDLVRGDDNIQVVDLTGGAPELNPHFRYLVEALAGEGRRVIDRCNLTVLLEPGQEDTPAFLAAHRVEVVASLPCYTAKNTDAQRGSGVFGASIEGLRRLCAVGYGRPDGELPLTLVYNPGGAFLPGPAAALEGDYRDRLAREFGIEFTNLVTMVNMPIRRFADRLRQEGGFERYMESLRISFNPRTVNDLMCRHLVSVAHDGRIYDCDFNLAMDLRAVDPGTGGPVTVFDIDSFSSLVGADVATGDHCLGCTAGSGSSCFGALD
jgi:radical SAM/Cys-rich protein